MIPVKTPRSLVYNYILGPATLLISHYELSIEEWSECDSNPPEIERFEETVYSKLLYEWMDLCLHCIVELYSFPDYNGDCATAAENHR